MLWDHWTASVSVVVYFEDKANGQFVSATTINVLIQFFINETEVRSEFVHLKSIS